MSGYAVFFQYNDDKNSFRLPTNPEEIEVTSTQAVEKYEVLRLGQVAVPTHTELKEYSFECEFPIKHGNSLPGYVETTDGYDYHKPDYYLNRFEFWRDKLTPFRFIAGRTNLAETDVIAGGTINDLVLIEELTVTEKAGEEGDKYVKFKLLEYRVFGKKIPDKIMAVTKSGVTTAKKKKSTTTKAVTPKSNGYYIVKSGDSLWTVAKKLYNDGSKNNIIYNANKEKIKNPSVLSVGIKLKIPTESEFSKYSAALPVMKTEKAKAAGANKIYTCVSDKPIAGISLTLENGKYVHQGSGSTLGSDKGGFFDPLREYIRSL